MTAQIANRVARLEASSPDHAPGFIVLTFRADEEGDRGTIMADLVRTGFARSNDLFICLRRFSDTRKLPAPYRITAGGTRQVSHGGH